MQICCTKKLTAVSGVEVEKDYVEKDNFFVWSANIVSVNFKKMLVAVNDHTGFGFVKYGIEIEEFKDLEEYIKLGIKTAFEEEEIPKDKIDLYFENAGKMVFSWTKGPIHVSKLNRTVLKAESFYKYLNNDSIYQSKVTKMMNGHFDKYGETYIPYQNLIEEFDSWY